MNGENSKLSSFGNAFIYLFIFVVLEKKGRVLIKNVLCLAFNNILSYSDKKKSNLHKKGEKALNLKLLVFFFFFLPSHRFFLVECA